MDQSALNVLTDAEIAEILAQGRNRGGYLPPIQKLHASTDVYVDFMSLTGFKGKNAASVRNSVKQNLDKWLAANPDVEDEYKVVLTDATDDIAARVLLINVTRLNAATSTENDAEDEDAENAA